MSKKLWIIPIGIGAVILVAWLGGTIVKLLWNWLMPELFGWPQLTYWQALGLLALCRILFGGVGGRGGGSHRKFSREDKERFRARVKERWGTGAPAADQPAVGPTAEL